MTGQSAPTLLTPADPRYPAPLRDLSHPPATLWCLGTPDALQSAGGMVAIVGTREASAYGERVAGRLAAGCVRAGLVVVSGLARGIDAAAHRAAMTAGGRTVAVLGTGVDVPYPAGHRALHAAIQAHGAVISEMEPGRLAFPGCFPRRNRIIAALAQVTVVVEAGFKSGAINTASQALELGRVVAAVPGQVDDPRAAGANGLIRDGAQVVTDVDDLLTILGLSTFSGSWAASRPDETSDLRSKLVGSLGDGLATPEGLADRLGVPLGEVSKVLLDLELEGVAVREGGGYFAAGSRWSRGGGPG